MNTVSSKLSSELYELSGWNDQLEMHSHIGGGTPLYSLGYLLRKLPNDHRYRTDLVKLKGVWEAYLWGPSPFESLGSTALIVLASGADESPEEAVALLAVRLFKEGILTKEST